MGSTSVNDVGNLFGGLNASAQAQMMGKISNTVSNDTSSTSPSFESIFTAGLGQDGNASKDAIIGMGADKKAEGYPKVDQKNNSDRIAGEDKRDAGKTSRTDNQDKVSDNAVKETAVDKNTTKKSDDLDAEDIEKAEEALSTVAAALLERIEEILQISPEEAESLLENMGMSVEDLLSSEGLSAFALQAMGAEDSLALLTDESKYEQFQNITAALEELLKSGSGIESMSVEELRNLLDEMSENDDASSIENAVPDMDELKDGAEELADRRIAESSQNGKDDSQNEKGADLNGQAQAGTEGFIQTLETSEMPATGEIYTGTNTASAQQIADQILDYIKSNAKADTQTLEMQLHPASLGNVQISLTNKGGDISASFIAQNEQVRAVLESQMIQLQERFEEQGIKVTSIEVSVGTNSFSENLEQQGHREEEQAANSPKRVRRLQITPGMDIPEALDEDDKLAAEMLAANGGTMDVQV